MSDYTKKLTNEELKDFTSRVVVQLEPTLTQQVMSILYELSQYREKIENGTLRDLGCKSGDTIYYVNTIKVPPRIEKYEVYAIYVHNKVAVQVDYNAFLLLEDICLTKEEAEKKLKEKERKWKIDKLK